ncbi:pyrroline-5-carboxylate reductase [Acetobacteraceae bacterium ESL0709]|nr:pyrroline-5-carboxylate reductase [Acetobacteraceae bacterium ESL0697]MDF7677193.1 pyrroline-5-carboxylate reductase [Acetobacteraceae bacterium ESL0709]
MKTPTLLLLGCGKMGGALAQGWMDSQHPPQLLILDRKLQKAPGNALIYRKIQEIPSDIKPDLIILAVKPAMAEEMITALKTHLGDKMAQSALLSVMAAKSCAQLAHMSGNEATPVIRTMPNTPASVGAGAIGMYFSPHVTEDQKLLAKKLMGQVGEVVIVPHEDDLRSVIAVSGSSPAYVFLLAELLERTGIELGLEQTVARKLARTMIYGAGKMLHDLDDDATTLRENVTSPNGTTAAALHVLMDEKNWPRTIRLASQEAVRRAKELDH